MYPVPARQIVSTRLAKLFTLAAMSLGFGVVQLDVTIVNTALNSIFISLGGGVSQLRWVVSAYTIAFAALILTAIGVIAALEDDLRRPVLTANQVSLWYALRVAGAEVSVDDYGQLFKLPCRQSEIPSRPLTRVGTRTSPLG